MRNVFKIAILFLLTAEVCFGQMPHDAYNFLALETGLSSPQSPYNLRDYKGVLIVLAHIPNDAAENNSENLLAEYYGTAYFDKDSRIGLDAGKVSLNDRVLDNEKIGSYDFYYFTREGRKNISFRDAKMDWDIEGKEPVPEFIGDSLSQYFKFPLYYYFSLYNKELLSESIQSSDLASVLSLNTTHEKSSLRNLEKPDFVVTFLTSLTKEIADVTNFVQIYRGTLTPQIENKYEYMGSLFNSQYSSTPYPKGKYTFVARSYKAKEVNVPVAKEGAFTEKWLFLTCVETQVDWLLK